VSEIRLFGFRLLLWPTLFTIPAFITLIGLGVWQLDRLDRKLNLIAQVESRMALAPERLPADITDPDALKFRHITVTGTFLHEHEMHLLAHTERGQVGYQVITPLIQPDGRAVLVNRGWVPDTKRDPAARPEGQVTGEVTVTGLARPGWPQGLFVPNNAPQANFWFWGDLDGMAKAAGLTQYAPVFVEADATPNPGGLPVGGQTRITFTNDHLQYAITWFCLAIALVVIFIIYHRTQVQKQDGV
jgi:surfeit locus 1 family protein